jgi:hypothetical protein
MATEEEAGEASEGFRGLVKYTVPGYVAGLAIGGLLDWLGFQTSAIGQWLVRTLSGEGESILEGVYALRRRLGRKTMGMAEAYGWGKLVGMTVPWWIDWVSRIAGVDVYGVGGFYIPYFYGMSDQIGASLSGLLYLRKHHGGWRAGFANYIRHPVMISGLVLILAVPAGLLLARLLGFSPTTQVLTSLETIASNLCWIPPVVGWISESKRKAEEKADQVPDA